MRRVAAAFLLLAMSLVPPAVAEPADCITIENFGSATPGVFPPDWRVRKESAKAVYRIVDDGALRFLRASAVGLGVQAALERKWDLATYPVLTWAWRPRRFPAGANEQAGKNDSALAVYLLVPYSRIRGPKAVKYIWSERVPAGTRLESNFGLTQVKVLRTGADPGEAWVTERVNVLDDFRALFGVTDTPSPAGIAVLTDADDTRSSAEGDYANFRACRS